MLEQRVGANIGATELTVGECSLLQFIMGYAPSWKGLLKRIKRSVGGLRCSTATKLISTFITPNRNSEQMHAV